MTKRGTSDGRRPPNCGRSHGVSRRGQSTINSSTSINHILIFTPSHGPPRVILRIIKQKCDEPWSSWKKAQLEVRDLWFREFKKEYTWDSPQEQTIRVIFEQTIRLKYEQRQQEVQKFTTKEATFGNDSNFVSINDNDIYLEVVGGKNEKGNVYGLGKLTNKFIIPMV
ncbi:hypothetical protein CR513_53509, partial [Mucuna pruriens]